MRCSVESLLRRTLFSIVERVVKKAKGSTYQGKFVFSTQEVLEIAKQAELDSAAKRGRKRGRTAAIDVKLSAGEDKVLETGCL
jgi:hypothetical protein